MSPDKRTKLSAAQAAAHLRCSVSALYRKAATDPGFPKPQHSSQRHKSNGKPLSFWYRDDLDNYTERQEPRRTLLGLARRCADSDVGTTGVHPVVLVFLLAGGDLPMLAVETDLPEEGLQLLCDSDSPHELDDEVLVALYSTAVAQVLHKERELLARAEADSSLVDDDSYRDQMQALNEAHRLCFGQPLQNASLKEGRRDGSA